jgi:hypothetical protein
MKLPRLLVVGLKSSLSVDPDDALEPFTPNGAGERLWRMVSDVVPVTKEDYFFKIDFTNVSHGASRVLKHIGKRPVVVLGREAWNVLGLERSAPFFSRRCGVYLIPHPSGRTRLYNSPKTRARAGKLIAGLM